MMLEQMTSAEFGEAMAYAAIDPCGEYRNELRHGQLVATFLNAKGIKKPSEPSPPDPDAWRPSDFMNFTERPPEKETTPEENFARIDKEVFGL